MAHVYGLVALEDSTVIAAVQLQSDGEIQAHLWAIVVAEAWRGAGLGRGMLREALRLGASPSPGFASRGMT